MFKEKYTIIIATIFLFYTTQCFAKGKTNNLEVFGNPFSLENKSFATPSEKNLVDSWGYESFGTFFDSGGKPFTLIHEFKNIPPTTPPIIATKIACILSYVDPFGEPLGGPQVFEKDLNNIVINGTSTTFQFNSDNNKCVYAFICGTIVKIQGTDTQRSFTIRWSNEQDPRTKDSCTVRAKYTTER
jgi:hypothetical protein